MKASKRDVSLHGVLVGKIWMPACECTKDVTLAESDFRHSDNSRPTLRDFALKATNDGDFQSCSLTSDSVFEFKRIRETGTRRITQRRFFQVSQFPSVADCIDARESCEVCQSEED
jgi:hypothetical protein